MTEFARHDVADAVSPDVSQGPVGKVEDAHLRSFVSEVDVLPVRGIGQVDVKTVAVVNEELASALWAAVAVVRADSDQKALAAEDVTAGGDSNRGLDLGVIHEPDGELGRVLLTVLDDVCGAFLGPWQMLGSGVDIHARFAVGERDLRTLVGASVWSEAR